MKYSSVLRVCLLRHVVTFFQPSSEGRVTVPWLAADALWIVEAGSPGSEVDFSGDLTTGGAILIRVIFTDLS